MASVVFSSLGQAIGGPFGALAGAMAGIGVDGMLMGRGDRMAVGQVQRSAYGVPIPGVYGQARVAGILIWAHVMDQGSKGSGQRAGAASFAVALSSRPIQSIRRIWADGREIRNDEGDFESPVTMRVHDGRGMEPDPLIVATEGAGSAPAYGGIAYVVFEDMSLEAYGNRIPNLSFEVCADEQLPADWLTDLVTIPVMDGSSDNVEQLASGYVASATEARDDILTMSRLANAGLSEANGRAQFSASMMPYVISHDDLCVDPQSGHKYERSASESQRPSLVSLEYLDVWREYQAGLQQAERKRKGPEIRLSLPAAFVPSGARNFAYQSMRRHELEAETVSLTLGWKWLGLGVGDIIRLGSDRELWRVTQRAVRGFQVRILACRHVEQSSEPVVLSAESGRSMAVTARPIPLTDVGVFETPFPVNGRSNCIWVTANGAPGWRGAMISRLTSWSVLDRGLLENRQVSGILMNDLAAGNSYFWYENDDIIIRLNSGDIDLESRTAVEILDGANMIRIGGEILQFRSCHYVDDEIVRLDGLLRGRFGTRATMHAAGSRMDAVSMADLHPISLTEDMAGQTILINAEGAGDPPGGILSEYQVQALGFGQMAPCHFKCRRLVDGTIVSSWIPVSGEMTGWGSDDVPWTGGVWHFEGDNGFRYNIHLSECDHVLTREEQISIHGEIFPEGKAYVVTDGIAPVDYRMTEHIRI